MTTLPCSGSAPLTRSECPGWTRQSGGRGHDVRSTAVQAAITGDAGELAGPAIYRWAFQHVRELIPTVRISRGSGPPWRLPSDDRDIAEVRFRHEDRELSIADLLTDTYTDGFLVVHHGRIVTEQYFNGLAPDVPHLLMSVSKSVTSAVVGVLAGRSLLDASALVTGIVPELHRTSFEGATVQHLLDMRTGTRFDEDYDNPEADVRAYERVYLWRPDDGQARPDNALTY